MMVAANTSPAATTRPAASPRSRAPRLPFDQPYPTVIQYSAGRRAIVSNPPTDQHESVPRVHEDESLNRHKVQVRVYMTLHSVSDNVRSIPPHHRTFWHAYCGRHALPLAFHA